MQKVEDYNFLDKIKKEEGEEVLVLYSNLVYRAVDGAWKVVGRLDSEGNVIIRRTLP